MLAGVNAKMRKPLMISFIQLFSALRSRLFLVLLGISCELIYLLYFVRTFSVVTYGQSLNLIDLGAITHNSHTGFILFVMAFCILFALVTLAWWEVRQEEAPDRTPFVLIFCFGAIFAFTMSFCYPVTAIDVFIYIAQSHVLVTHHANPLITPAATFANDPLMTLAGQWGKSGAPYGPLGILVDAVPTLFAGRNVFLNLLLLKGMFSMMMLVCAWLVYSILAGGDKPQPLHIKRALAGMLLFAWNPLVLFEYSANSHNDVVIVLFVLLALFALTKEHPIVAFALILASASIKYATLPLIPLFFLYGIMHQSNHRKRLIYLLWIAGVSVVFVGTVYGPFWAGPHMFDSTLSHDDWYLSSLSVVLSDITSLGLSGERAKLVSRIIFGIFYLYALFLSTKRLPDIIRGAALAMFGFLAFGTVKFEPWYAIWGLGLMVLVPSIEVSLAYIFFSLGATLIAPTFAFIWIWGGRTGSMFDGLNSLTYLMAFVPAQLVIFGWKLRQLLVKIQGKPPPMGSIAKNKASSHKT